MLKNRYKMTYRTPNKSIDVDVHYDDKNKLWFTLEDALTLLNISSSTLYDFELTDPEDPKEVMQNFLSFDRCVMIAAAGRDTYSRQILLWLLNRCRVRMARIIRDTEKGVIMDDSHKPTSISFNNVKLNLKLDVVYITGVETEWFKASDLAKWLGYEKTKDMTKMLDNSNSNLVRKLNMLDNNGRSQEYTLISEPAVYRIIITLATSPSSLIKRKEQCEEFFTWLTSEVLPSIRRKRVYIDNTLNEDQLVELLEVEIDKLTDEKALLEMKLDNKLDEALEKISDSMNIVSQFK
ncbi:MAG: BRO-N domain-containing protein [Peptostreptococcaceae bacterium]